MVWMCKWNPISGNKLDMALELIELSWVQKRTLFAKWEWA